MWTPRSNVLTVLYVNKYDVGLFTLKLAYMIVTCQAKISLHFTTQKLHATANKDCIF